MSRSEVIRRLRDGDPWRAAGDRPGHVRLGGALVWGAFIAFPIFSAVTGGGNVVRHWLIVAGAVVFSAGYVWLCMLWARPEHAALVRGVSVALVALAVALTAAGASHWGFLFSYVAACAALSTPSPYGFLAVVTCALVGAGATLVGHGGVDQAVSFGASALGVGLLLTLMRDLRERTVQLGRARAELARTAVIAERERFARDLHDLLGHSLSVIAIKAELAGRLLPDAVDRAAAEVADLETVARSALGEVREAVSGYRRPTLDGELEGARIALAAAGIIAEFERSPLALPAEVEAVLAWAVREGATNVIRHSGARRCEVRVRSEADGARVEVVDDGAVGAVGAVGASGASVGVGNGLAGLRERTAAVRGHLEAGAVAGGGYRLTVVVPGQARLAVDGGAAGVPA